MKVRSLTEIKLVGEGMPLLKAPEENLPLAFASFLRLPSFLGWWSVSITKGGI